MQQSKQRLTVLCSYKPDCLKNGLAHCLDSSIEKNVRNVGDPLWPIIWDTVRWNVAARVYHNAKGL